MASSIQRVNGVVASLRLEISTRSRLRVEYGLMLLWGFWSSSSTQNRTGAGNRPVDVTVFQFSSDVHSVRRKEHPLHSHEQSPAVVHQNAREVRPEGQHIQAQSLAPGTCQVLPDLKGPGFSGASSRRHHARGRDVLCAPQNHRSRLPSKRFFSWICSFVVSRRTAFVMTWRLRKWPKFGGGVGGGVGIISPSTSWLHVCFVCSTFHMFLVPDPNMCGQSVAAQLWRL